MKALPKPLAAGAVSAVVLIPIFWLPQIASADLASHAYNAWLTLLLERGEIGGFDLAPQRTNVAFDWMLAGLMPWAGPTGAQRIAVGFSVLLLFWASLLLLREGGRRATPWHLIPSVAMLCYGFVFHVGLFNFYLSLGCAILAMGLLWRPTVAKAAAAAVATACGLIAHPLAVGWGAAVMTYVAIARRLRPRDRLYVAGALTGVIFVLSVVVQRLIATRWSPVQAWFWTGADQAILAEDVFGPVAWAWFLWWAVLLFLWVERRGWTRVALSIPSQIVFLNAFGIAVLPTALALPGYSAGFQMLAERMSLAQGLMVCLLLSRTPVSFGRIAVAGGLAVIFFGAVYQLDRRLIEAENRIGEAVATLPARSRVLNGLCTPDVRFDYGYHLLDRACIGRCYSYGNFEPTTGQFRLRARPGNGIVADTNARADEFEKGNATILAVETPIYRVERGSGDSVVARRLSVGETITAPCKESAE
jgi:hypothetical protein